jgi:hypothetical protein
MRHPNLGCLMGQSIEMPLCRAARLVRCPSPHSRRSPNHARPSVYPMTLHSAQANSVSRSGPTA